MTVLELSLRAIGVFYLFAGFLGLHAMAMDALMDQMLAGLTLQPTKSREVVRRRMLAAGSYTVGLSGAALMVLSIWAVPLFLIATLLQWGWLLWARTHYPPEGALDTKGRRQTTNAATIYTVVGIAVTATAVVGALRPWSDPWALLLPVVGVGLALFATRHMLWKAKPPAHGAIEADAHATLGDEDEDQAYGPPVPPPVRLRVQPTWGGHDLLDADTGKPFPYYDYVPHDLNTRFYYWTQAFRAGDDPAAKELWAEFETPEDEAAHRAEGDALVAELSQFFGMGKVDGPVYPSDVRYVGRNDAQ